MWSYKDFKRSSKIAEIFFPDFLFTHTLFPKNFKIFVLI